jgi:hypothetical protein
MIDPYLHTIEPAVERETILDERIEAGNGNLIPCDVQYDYVVVEGKILIIDIEVKTAFTPSGYQESVIAMIEERQPGCQFNSHPAFKMIKLKN